MRSMHPMRPMQGINEVGAGPWSGWSTLGTAADVPLPPPPPTLTAPPSASGLCVGWAAPDAQGSRITGACQGLCLREIVFWQGSGAGNA